MFTGEESGGGDRKPKVMGFSTGHRNDIKRKEFRAQEAAGLELLAITSSLQHAIATLHDNPTQP